MLLNRRAGLVHEVAAVVREHRLASDLQRTVHVRHHREADHRQTVVRRRIPGSDQSASDQRTAAADGGIPHVDEFVHVGSSAPRYRPESPY